MPTRKGHDADANTRYRSKRRKKRGHARSVPGGHVVKPMSSHGRTEASRAGKGERKMLAAWDNMGGRGTTVHWVKCTQGCEAGTKCNHGHTGIRDMAPSGRLPLSDVFPHTEPGTRMVTTVKNGKVTVTHVRLHTDAKVDGDCANVGAVDANEARSDRWTEHGHKSDGGWKAGARARTESAGFARSLHIERRGW